jgi:hypothetical protein
MTLFTYSYCWRIRSTQMIIAVMIIDDDDDNYWRYFDWHCNLLLIFWFWKSWFFWLHNIYYYGLFYYFLSSRSPLLCPASVCLVGTASYIFKYRNMTNVVGERDPCLTRYQVRTLQTTEIFHFTQFRCTYSRSRKINVKSVSHTSH